MTDAQKRIDGLVEDVWRAAYHLFAVPGYARPLTPAQADTLIDAQRLIARVLMPLVENQP